MRNLILIVLVACGIVLIGCKKSIDYNTSEGPNIEMRNQGPPNSSTILPLPEGTELIHNGQEILYNLPEGYLLVGIDKTTNAFVSSAGGKINCNCISNDGTCQPFETKNQVGCSSDKDDICTRCNMTNSIISGQDLSSYFISIESKDVFPDFDNEMVFVNTLEIWKSLDWIDSTDIQNNIQEINNTLDYISSNSQGETSVLVAIALSNRKALLEVPFELVEPGMMYTLNLKIDSQNIGGSGTGPNTVTNLCEGCASKCKYKTSNLGKIRYCDGCKTVCTLSY